MLLLVFMMLAPLSSDYFQSVMVMSLQPPPVPISDISGKMGIILLFFTVSILFDL